MGKDEATPHADHQIAGKSDVTGNLARPLAARMGAQPRSLPQAVPPRVASPLGYNPALQPPCADDNRAHTWPNSGIISKIVQLLTATCERGFVYTRRLQRRTGPLTNGALRPPVNKLHLEQRSLV